MPWERSVDVDDMDDLIRAEQWRRVAVPQNPEKCRVEKISRLPGLAEALEYQRNHFAQIIWEDTFRFWLYGMAAGKNIPEFLEWTERHVYFDGLAVLVDGECVNDEILENMGSGIAHHADRRLEAYLEEKVGALSRNVPSCRLVLSEGEGVADVRC